MTSIRLIEVHPRFQSYRSSRSASSEPAANTTPFPLSPHGPTIFIDDLPETHISANFLRQKLISRSGGTPNLRFQPTQRHSRSRDQVPTIGIIGMRESTPKRSGPHSNKRMWPTRDAESRSENSFRVSGEWPTIHPKSFPASWASVYNRRPK